MRTHRLRLHRIYRTAILASAVLVLGAVTATVAQAATTPWGSIRQVSLMQFGSRLYMAWIDPHANNELTIASTTDGVNWAPGTHPFGSGNSNSAPALTVFAGKLWMAWTGTDSNHTLNLASSTNGINFTGATQPLGRNNSADGPALAVYKSRLYYAWKGTDFHTVVNIASSANGVTFTNPIQPGLNSTINAPALAVWNGDLYMAWSGADSSNLLNLAFSSDGTNFSQFHFQVGSQFEPAMSPAPGSGAGSLDIEYKATNAELNVINYVGVVNVNPSPLVGPIVQAPDVTDYNGTMVHAWLGTDPGHTINVCFQGSSPPC